MNECAQSAADSEMKIIDFGLSRVDDEVEHMSTKVSPAERHITANR